jgi:hypothetical protein
MIVINTVSGTKFSFNGVTYHKNFMPFVTGDKIAIINVYDACITLTDAPTHFSEYTVNGVTYTSVEILQASLLDVIYTRLSLGTISGTGTVTNVSLSLGSTGSDINGGVASPTTTPIITLNFPNASSINRGVLSSADWITFNGKQNALGFTPYNATNPAGYITSASLEPLEFNTTEKTVWNNGKGDVETNTSFGQFALRSNTSGQNTAFGFQALRDNTTGGSNTAFGLEALRDKTSGSGNTALGAAAGLFLPTGGTNTICSSSVFLGSSARPLDNNQTNQIVIGATAIGLGSNTATLGNASITITRLRGEVRGGSFVRDGGTSSQFLKADGSVDSNSYLPLSGGTLASSGSANTLNINHTSGSGIALNISKDGNGEALTIVKGSGSGNAASITGGITLLSELNLTTKLADAHINSAATWNAKIGGSGTTNYLAKFTASGEVGNSAVFESGGNVGIGTTSPNVSGIEISRNTGSVSPTPAELRISTATNAADWSAALPWGRLSFYSNDTSVGGAKINAALDVISTGSTGGLSDLVFSLAQPTTGALVERMRLSAGGNVGIGTTSPTFKLDVNGTFRAQSLNITVLNTAPATATSAGVQGEIRVTATHIYVCTATNTWVRTALTTF